MQTVSQLVTVLVVCCSGALSALIPDGEHQVEKTALEGDHSVLTPHKSYHLIHECINTTSVDGVFYIKSQGQEETCGLYLFSDADTVIELELEHVNVPCHTGGLIALVDGWEMNGQLWPHPTDHARPVRDRKLEYCGTSPPPQRFRSGQNAALLQYRLPAAGSAVSIRVRHVPNPAPCNQLMDGTAEVFTLRNFGQRDNCTLLSMNPVEVQMLPFRVGVSTAGIMRHARAGPLHKCTERGWPDYVEVGETASLDTSMSVVTSRLCGLSLSSGPTQSACGMLVTRLVSSGFFDNVVTVRARLLSTDEMMTHCFAQYDIPAEYEEALKDYNW